MKLPADKALVVLTVALAPITNVKIAGAEPINYASVVLFAFGVLAIARNRQATLLLPRRLVPLARAWLLFVLLVTVIALWLDWRLKFYIPPGMSLMRHPPALTFTRMWKLGIDIGFMFVLVSLFFQNPKLVRDSTRIYLTVGVLNAIYALICFSLCVAGASRGSYSGVFGAYTLLGVTRARGFFVEGGPFGVYLVTVLMVLLVERYVLRDLSRSLFASCVAVLVAAIVAAQSKAAFCLIAALALWSFWRSRRLRYLITSGALALALGTWFVFGDLATQFQGYIYAYENIYTLALSNPTDINVLEGRAVAAHVVPAILADRPFFGVGLGNYPVTRSNPDYSWPLQAAPGWDSGGLGLIGDGAELGLPLLMFFVALVWTPVLMATRSSVHRLVVLLAGCQFWVHLFGASIPFLYPYLTTALALGLILGPKGRRACPAAG